MVYFYFVFFYLWIFLIDGDEKKRLKKTFEIKKQPNEFMNLNQLKIYFVHEYSRKYMDISIKFFMNIHECSRISMT